MSISRSLLVAAISVAAINVNATEKETWGLVSGIYNVGASKMVTKDIGTLQVTVNVTCAEEVAAANEKMQSTISQIQAEIEKESNLSLVSASPELTVTSQAQYLLSHRNGNYLQPFYVDTCNQNKEVNVGVENIDLGKKIFTVAVTLKIETRKELSSLTVLRQKLQVFAEKLNKEDAQTAVAVANEQLYVSEEKKADEMRKLKEEARLVGNSNRTRLDVDSDVYGGFKDSYIATFEGNSYSEYKSYEPKLTVDGKSKVTVPYTFSIQYIPSNLVKTSSATYPKDGKGTLTETLEGFAIVDTDYYVASLNFTTSCHPTREAAIAATKLPYETFSQLAGAVVVENGGDFERVEEVVGEATDDNKWQPWELVRDANNNTTVKSYVSLCNAKVSEVVRPDDRTYSVVHTLTVVTSNYAGLKDLEAKANIYTEQQRKTAGAQRVEVAIPNIEPRLQDKKHFNAVEILAYESAVSQFLDPAGQVANILLDEVQASEAYYTSNKGGSPSTFAAPKFASENLVADAGSDSGYVVVVTSDGKIPMTELRADHSYSVRFRPKKDLIQILKEGRKSTEESEQAVNQPIL